MSVGIKEHSSWQTAEGNMEDIHHDVSTTGNTSASDRKVYERGRNLCGASEKLPNSQEGPLMMMVLTDTSVTPEEAG